MTMRRAPDVGTPDPLLAIPSDTPGSGATGAHGYRRSSFILRRIAMAPLIMLGSCFVVFVVIDLSPNDPAEAALGQFASKEMREAFAAEHHLDAPLLIRFGQFLVDVGHFNLGESTVRSESVGELISMALPATLQLMVLSALLAVLVATTLGIIAAKAEGRLPDRIISTLAALGQAAPGFWVGLLLIQVFAVSWGIIPSGGYVSLGSGFAPWFSSMIGPASVLAIGFGAALTRVIRASVAEELTKDYVRSAAGSGLTWPRILFRNVLSNALITPITVLGMYVGALMSGAVLVEVVFNIPGMGSLLINGVNQGDLGVVRGVAILAAAAFVLANLAVDLIYLLIGQRSAEADAR